VLRALKTSEQNLKDAPPDCVLHGAEALEYFIPRIEEAFIFQHESGKIEAWGATSAACLGQEIDRCMGYGIEYRFTIIQESVIGSSSEILRRTVQFSKIHPGAVEIELRPQQLRYFLG
jgi:hypothetical protein